MITKLTENDILEYLMTSEFTEGLTPDEFRFLLIKFRNFYRISAGKVDYFKVELDSKKKEIEEVRSSIPTKINLILSEKANIEDNMNRLKNRNLSWKERFLGKIILENETH
jgi:hypothetical protein